MTKEKENLTKWFRFRISDDLMEGLKRLAGNEGRSAGSMLRQLIWRYIEVEQNLARKSRVNT